MSPSVGRGAGGGRCTGGKGLGPRVATVSAENVAARALPWETRDPPGFHTRGRGPAANTPLSPFASPVLPACPGQEDAVEEDAVETVLTLRDLIRFPRPVSAAASQGASCPSGKDEG